MSRKQPPMASDPLIAAVEAARERGVIRAVLLTEEQGGEITLRSIGEWNGLELRGLAPMMLEIVAAQDADEEDDD